MADAKMAKSTGNVVRVAVLPEMGHEPLVFRYLALTAHYRSKLDFTQDAMHAAESGLARLRRVAAGPAVDVELGAVDVASYRSRFVEAVAETSGHREPSRSRTRWPGRPSCPTRSVEVCSGTSTACWDCRNAPAAAEAPLPDGAAELLERRAAARAARDFAPDLRCAP